MRGIEKSSPKDEGIIRIVPEKCQGDEFVIVESIIVVGIPLRTVGRPVPCLCTEFNLIFPLCIVYSGFFLRVH